MFLKNPTIQYDIYIQTLPLDYALKMYNIY